MVKDLMFLMLGRKEWTRYRSCLDMRVAKSKVQALLVVLH